MRLFVVFVVIFFISLPPAHADNETASRANIVPATESALASKSLLLDISPVGPNKVVAVGQHGHILLSSDGDNWQQANVPVRSTLTSVYFLNDQLGWAVGHDATILHSSDGGLNWKIQQYLPALEKPLLDIYFKDAQQGVAVGSYGQVFRSEDGGATWHSEFHQELLPQDDLEYINELKTEDEEAYLDEIAFILPHFNSLVPDGNTLYLLGEMGLLAKSIDFGLTWQQFDSFYQGSFFSMGKTQKGNLLAAGLRGHIFLSLNNGLNWQEVATNTTALLNDIVFTNDERIFVLGNNGMLLISTDEGESFMQRPQQDGKALIAGIWFKSKLLAVSDVGIKVLSLPKG
ncbi:WD40/YVTN/BNR-like repeat-containing protein [Colwellia psychrerythraea]|uniref:Photosynthesis system II assembly factor Ycf48/Hcf136-like domain-containing protein n=1 Tax=Colwellia psychrerythraea TaxID=28229 RepID=A0A099KQP9_COLPS|nr:YCF48-related protein [Colwellia psychrerythraea]KGJ92836.1 hypothetical protein GAB14E_2752 [Colwellia psychrerythraea]